MKRQNDVLDFELLRNKRQIKSDKAILSLYHSYLNFLKKEVNIREKVRAKHVFRLTFQVAKEEVDTAIWEPHFWNWFAFDYTNVMGTSMFSLYLKQQRVHMSETDLMISAILMTVKFEPIILKDNANGSLWNGIDPTTNEKATYYVPSEQQKVNKEDLIFLRSVRSGVRKLVVGPVLRMKNDTKDEILCKIKDNFKREHDNWRLYLKKHSSYFYSKADIQ
jgi:hypothetical protein